MRAAGVLIVLVAISGAVAFISCSQKTSSPTKPADPSPACALRHTSLGFGDVLVGSSIDRQFTLTNSGGGTLSGTVTDTSAVYSIVGTSAFSLTAGQAMTFTVRFTPSHPGARNCTLQLGTGCVVACSGTGTAPPILDCEVTPTSIDFGVVTLGQVVDRTFTLKNLSTATMTGTVSGTTSVFTVPGATSYSLAPGETATFIVRFSSSQPGPFSADIQTGQPGCPTVSCAATAQTVCAVSTDNLDFGLVASGTLTKKSFTITNVGSAVLTGVVGTAGTCDGLAVEGAPVNFNLAPGQSTTITVDFAPFGGEGVFGCTVRVVGTGVSCPDVNCTGVAQFPCNCSVGPTSIDFGDVIIGSQYSRQFTISAGGETAIGGVISVLGSGFVLSTISNPNILSTSLGYAVDGGSSQAFNLVYQPQVLGPTSASLAISQTLCTRIGSPCDTIRCRGNGITTPSCAVSTTTLDFGSVDVGQTRDLSLVVTNTGAGQLSGAAGPSPCPEFAFQGPTTYSLSVGQSATLTLRYIPRVAGQTTTCSPIPIGSVCQALTAVGAAIGPPTCALSTTSLDFGSVTVGQSKDLTFDISNSGGGTLCGTVTEIAPALSIVQNASYCITAPAFVRVTVRFTPTAPGSIFADINAGNGCPRLTARGIGV